MFMSVTNVWEHRLKYKRPTNKTKLASSFLQMEYSRHQCCSTSHHINPPQAQTKEWLQLLLTFVFCRLQTSQPARRPDGSDSKSEALLIHLATTSKPPQILERILRKPRVNQHPYSIKSWLFIHGRYGGLSRCYIWPSMLAPSPEMSPTRQWTDLTVWIHEEYNVKDIVLTCPLR